MKTKTFIILSIIICFILGTCLHFTYELSGENNIIAIFSSVNESVWEHLKLVYFPMLITACIGYFIVKKETNNYLFAQIIGIICSMRIYNNIFLYIYRNYRKKLCFIRHWFFFCSYNNRRMYNI